MPDLLAHGPAGTLSTVTGHWKENGPRQHECTDVWFMCSTTVSLHVGQVPWDNYKTKCRIFKANDYEALDHEGYVAVTPSSERLIVLTEQCFLIGTVLIQVETCLL